MAVERVTIVNPNGRKGVVSTTSKAATQYKHAPSTRDADPDQLPAKNASHQTWADYATQHGLSSEEAADMSRDELVAHFTS